uniref:Uncharacterized protein n=1 Tax=Wood duck chaphamaparvovirus TaxID=2759604 RepID=A0A7D6X031_9VIRU|nr:hypothetical protein [Wood duck chaphamaparvovirus]
MAGFGASTGFTLLVWVDPESWRFEGLDEEQRLAKKAELLQDACTLLCGRWGMESSIMEHSGESYAFFSCPRFVVSSATLLRALGTLASCIKFHRGSPTDKPELLIAYRQCLLKYAVPDRVSEDSFGKEFGESQSGHTWGNVSKRPRTK